MAFAVLVRCVMSRYGDPLDCHHFDTDDRKTEPTISKMEQVEDEPRLCRECEEYAGDGMYCASNHLVYDFDTCKDEPQNTCKECKHYL